MMTVQPVTRPEISDNRFYALDALRGLAILAMLLSSEMPFGANSLPAWMYHAQVPPPDHRFIPLPGITWVDLVFPFFLFSMGAAFSAWRWGRRLAAGVSQWAVAAGILKRGFLLGFFAFFVMAIRPYVLSDHPTPATWLLALCGFAILFPILARLPARWPRNLHWAIRATGWSAALFFLIFVRYPDGSGFRLARSDIIIVVLANMGRLWRSAVDGHPPAFNRPAGLDRHRPGHPPLQHAAPAWRMGHGPVEILAGAVDLPALLPAIPVHRPAGHHRGRSHCSVEQRFRGDSRIRDQNPRLHGHVFT